MGLSHGRVESDARLDGKTVIITGCNSGIGKETALRLAKIGANVIMACRDLKRAEEAAAEIRTAIASTKNAGTVRIEQLDLASLASVRECARRILDAEPQIHLLINNAGVMMTPAKKTVDGFELQFGTNHLGHFLFTCLLLQRIVASAPARIITVSSLAHFLGKIHFDNLGYSSFLWPFGPIRNYGQSKLANILFTRELAKQLEGTGVTTYALHPGVVRTELTRYLDKAFFRGVAPMVLFVLKPIWKTPEQGADTTVYCAIDEKAGTENGLYYTDCKVKAPWRQALNDATAKRLWDESAKLVKLDFDPFEGLPTKNGRQSKTGN